MTRQPVAWPTSTGLPVSIPSQGKHLAGVQQPNWAAFVGDIQSWLLLSRVSQTASQYQSARRCLEGGFCESALQSSGLLVSLNLSASQSDSQHPAASQWVPVTQTANENQSAILSSLVSRIVLHSYTQFSRHSHPLRHNYSHHEVPARPTT